MNDENMNTGNIGIGDGYISVDGTSRGGIKCPETPLYIKNENMNVGIGGGELNPLSTLSNSIP